MFIIGGTGLGGAAKLPVEETFTPVSHPPLLEALRILKRPAS